MKKNIPGTYFFLLICYSLIGINQISCAQELEKAIETKLTSGAKKKIDAAYELKQKGTAIEQKASETQAQATINSELDKKKAEQRYSLKRLEAGDLYVNAIKMKYDVLKETIKDFWKKFKGDKQALSLLKTYEMASLDSLKKGFELKKKTETITKVSERLAASLLVEASLNKYLLILEKVSYCYLNWPLEYDKQWLTATDDRISGKTATDQANSLVTMKDTIVKEATNKDTANRDTTVIKSPPEQLKDTGTSMVKKIQEIVIMPDKAKPVTMPTASPITKAPPVESVVINLKDTVVSLPVNYQGNDSSLYGIVKVNEEEVDQFNGFIKKKYPEKYEDYVINFQDMDYSNVDELKKAWYRYKYGSAPTDSLVSKNTFKTLPGDTSSRIIALNDSIITVDSMMHNTPIKGKDNIAFNQRQLNQRNKTNTTPKHSPNTQKLSDSQNVSRDFVFHVQIVACRTRMKSETIRNMCNCNDSIMEFIEDNWYKYAIGEYNTYREARALRNSSKIPGAFVIAYLHGKRIKITPAIAYKKRGS